MGAKYFLTIILLLAVGMFGIDLPLSKDTRIRFSYGSADLSAEEREKLAALAHAHSGRKGTVTICAFTDPERDAAELEKARLIKRLKEEKFRQLLKAHKVPPTVTASGIELLPGESEQLMPLLTNEKGKQPERVPTKPDVWSLAAQRAKKVRDYLIDYGHINPYSIVVDTEHLAPEGNEPGGVDTVITPERNLFLSLRSLLAQS